MNQVGPDVFSDVLPPETTYKKELFALHKLYRVSTSTCNENWISQKYRFDVSILFENSSGVLFNQKTTKGFNEGYYKVLVSS